ncbi:MAG TPA: hypothetical protein VLT45_00535 [Kofleriaceae bacterium]|nr:hypothetical protein [Kofleriaceae bacterium]
MLLHGKSFADFPNPDQTANAMLDDLTWWGRALRAARQEEGARP